VRFTIRGVGDQSFMGTVERLSPNADPVTRQVSIFVSLPNIGGKLLAGLFAEGRVEAARVRDRGSARGARRNRPDVRSSLASATARRSV
jgi:multidrug efflux pump subunit AcrA (membrane-fusion protein)